MTHHPDRKDIFFLSGAPTSYQARELFNYTLFLSTFKLSNSVFS